jgi:kynurenine formamidase
MSEQAFPGATADYGALQSMSPATILATMRLVRVGQVYDLGVNLGSQASKFASDRAAPFSYSRELSGASAGSGLQFCSEVVHGHLHQSTHIDALVHAQRDGKVHGGHLADAVQNDAGWTAMGAETIRPIICRGVLIDLAGAGGGDLPDGYVAGPKEIAEAVAAQSVELKPGDAVLIRTGKIKQFAANPLAAWNACPGISSAAAQWLAEQGMAVFGIDTASPDTLPIAEWTDLVHEELLIRRGIHIIENVYMEDLARDHLFEFAFVCLPLKIQGATGSWVRPIAIV